MRFWPVWILLLLAGSIYGCNNNDIDIEVYDDLAVLEGAIVPITEDRIMREIRDNPTILIHFTSYDRNCSYCVRSNVFVDQLARDLSGLLRVGRISWNPWTRIDGSRELLRLFKSRGVPLLLLFKNGQIVWRHDGYSNEDAQKISAEISKQL